MYGGTERVVSYLTEALVKAGHHVTLFASGDSRTGAQLISTCRAAIRLDSSRPDPVALHVRMFEQLSRMARNFDIIHFHTEHIQLPLARRLDTPCLVTLHGRLDIPGLGDLYDEYRDIPLVAISNSQRRQLPQASWGATIYHGVPPQPCDWSAEPGSYLAFLGRIAPEKRVDRAIEIARQARIPLRISAKVDAADRDYFTREIRPLIDGSFVKFVGEIDEAEKPQFLSNAQALLFPIDWPEPFGLVMIEAMRCGTPVVAFGNGSVPEVIDEGVTGFIVNSVEQAAAAVGGLGQFDRRQCRQRFERRFTAARMAQEYSELYQALVARKNHRSVRSLPTTPVLVARREVNAP
jgi:glycosyltransferase involved in cell wall biosynthesis